MKIDSNHFYFKLLPELEKVLQQKLAEKSVNGPLSLGDCIEIFLDFYHEYNAFDFFPEDLITDDDLHLGIGAESVWMQRSIMCNYDLDDAFVGIDYQVQLNLDLKPSDADQNGGYHEMEQWERGVYSVDFSEFKNKILNSDFVQKRGNEIPVSMVTKLNANA